MRSRTTFPRTLTAVGDVLDSVEEFAAGACLLEREAFDARLIVEELFVNLVTHNRGGADSIELVLERAPGRLTMRLQDFDVEGPDIEEIERNRVAAPSGTGGFGVHIARTLADSLAYEYDERTLTVTATMNLR